MTATYWFLLLVITSFLQCVSAQAITHVFQGPLVLGNIAQRILSRGELHSYTVIVPAGQYMKIAVTSPSVEIILRLWTPRSDQSSLELHLSPDSQQPVSWISTIPGEYRLELAQAVPSSDPKQYEIVLTEVRRAQSQDEKEISAQE